MELLQRAQSLLQECNDIAASLDQWKQQNPTLDVDGLQAMTSVLLAEQKFLIKVASTPAEEIKPAQMGASNVPYLKSLVAALVNSRNPVAVNKTFKYVLDPYTIIEPSEKFRALPITTSTTPQGKQHRFQGQSSSKASQRKQGPNIMKLSTSEPLSTGLSNELAFQVKIDLVADHGKSWLRINAGSVKTLVHEYAGMEDDSDDEEEEQTESSEDEESQDEDDETEDDGDHKLTTRSNNVRRMVKPIRVSKDTHADMVLLTRSLVLAADQNRLHYTHRPQVTLQFAGILPEESIPLEEMIQKSVRIGSVAQSIEDGTIEVFPVNVHFGPVDSEATTTLASTTPMDEAFAPFSIPQSVDDMVLFSKTLHLDITTLMALSSFLCHTIRPDPTLFTSPPLVLQAQQEHDQPLLPLLAKIFEGRERLVMTRTAATRFKAILSVIGGSEEKWRGRVMIHDPREATRLESRTSATTTAVPGEDGEIESEEDEIGIRERWIRGSDWAQQYGVFASGPPRVEVIEDILDQANTESIKISEATAISSASTTTTEEAEADAEEEKGSSHPGSPSWSLSAPSTMPASPTPGMKRKDINMNELHFKIFLTASNARSTILTANALGHRTVTRTGQVPSEMSVWFHGARSLAEAKLVRDPHQSTS
ncbi:hypothetical protein BG015_007094 [Linnemannia schmuckeri]|uniref:DUF1308 domain-containing protein n=1 Tax=Linnemannia schmuckeri TaxID=64567 RepID=A0A9P5VB39_9FUNG|nr:hypothetical protein BG015_007094 [Linnemannia schmuckeri]